MPAVRANGLQIGYDVHGAGPPMILLHGASSSGREDYAAQIPLFSKSFRIYLPDARGHASTRWDGPAGIAAADLVADLLGFADALRLTTFHLVGFSLGAMTALRFAVRFPARLRTLVLIGLSVEREPRTSVARRVLDPGRIERDDPAWAAELARRHDPVQGAGAWRGLLEAIVADVANQREITPGELRAVELPAMVVLGDRDPFTPVGQAWGLQRQLPDARLLVVPGCGHEVMVRRPAMFNEAMASFYRSTEAAARRRSGLEVEPSGAASGSLVQTAPAGAVPSAPTAMVPTAPATPAPHAPAAVGPPDSVVADGSLAHPSEAGRDGTDREWLARTNAGEEPLDPA